MCLLKHAPLLILLTMFSLYLTFGTQIQNWDVPIHIEYQVSIQTVTRSIDIIKYREHIDTASIDTF